MQLCRASLSILVLFASSDFAIAEICEYRLSALLGSSATTSVAIGSSSLAVSNAGFAAAGFYLIPHATTGAMMIGSTAVGASAAGTVGIIGGTGTGLGAVAATVTSPFVTVPAAVATLASLGLEAGCYFEDERINDPVMVYALLQAITKEAPASKIGLFSSNNEMWLRLNDHAEGQQVYLVRNLYVVNGELMYRDWFANTPIGYIAVEGIQGTKD